MKKILLLVFLSICTKYTAQTQNHNTGFYMDDFINRSYVLQERLDTFRRPYILYNYRKTSSLIGLSGRVEEIMTESWCGSYLNALVCNTFYRELGYYPNGLLQEYSYPGNTGSERFEYTPSNKVKKIATGTYQADGSFRLVSYINFLYYPNDSLRSVESYARPIDSIRFHLNYKDSVVYNQQGKRVNNFYYRGFINDSMIYFSGGDTFIYNSDGRLARLERDAIDPLQSADYSYNSLGQLETLREVNDSFFIKSRVVISRFSYYPDGRVYQREVSYPNYPKDSTRFTFAYNWPLLSVDNGTPQSKNVHIYPTPTTGPLQIELTDDFVLPAFISIYDISGRMVMQEALTEKTSSLNIGKFGAGTYLYSVRDKNGQSTGKIIKQ